jgi:hypothetical protein
MQEAMKRAVILGLFASAACADGPTPLAPEAEINGGDVALATASAVKGTGVFSLDQYVFFECAGEVVHNVFQVPYTFHRVVTPSGDYVYVEQWDGREATGTLTGLTTGTVWTRARMVSPYIERSTGGGMTHFVGRVTFTSATAPNIEVREVFHISRNASGEITSQHYELRCIK